MSRRPGCYVKKGVTSKKKRKIVPKIRLQLSTWLLSHCQSPLVTFLAHLAFCSLCINHFTDLWRKIYTTIRCTLSMCSKSLNSVILSCSNAILLTIPSGCFLGYFFRWFASCSYQINLYFHINLTAQFSSIFKLQQYSVKYMGLECAISA